VDSDLAESVQALKTVFEKRLIPANFGTNDKAVVEALKRKFDLPDRYAAFLQEADPVDVETVTPTERVRFIPVAELAQEQLGYGQGDADTPRMNGWREGWIVVAQGMLGDPYFFDTTRMDAEGDCPVMTAMSGAELRPVLCASTFASFVEILAAAMEVAEDFGDGGLSPDDEFIFREALGPKVRVIDQAALRAGHWTS
jgi:hypothetical protein